MNLGFFYSTFTTTEFFVKNSFLTTQPNLKFNGEDSIFDGKICKVTLIANLYG